MTTSGSALLRPRSRSGPWCTRRLPWPTLFQQTWTSVWALLKLSTTLAMFGYQRPDRHLRASFFILFVQSVSFGLVPDSCGGRRCRRRRRELLALVAQADSARTRAMPEAPARMDFSFTVSSLRAAWTSSSAGGRRWPREGPAERVTGRASPDAKSSARAARTRHDLRRPVGWWEPPIYNVVGKRCRAIMQSASASLSSTTEVSLQRVSPCRRAGLALHDAEGGRGGRAAGRSAAVPAMRSVQAAQRDLGDLLAAGVDGRQGRQGVARLVDVVEPDDGHILRDARPASCRTRIAPRAIRSLKATTPSKGTPRSSKPRIACAPVLRCQPTTSTTRSGS